MVGAPSPDRPSASGNFDPIFLGVSPMPNPSVGGRAHFEYRFTGAFATDPSPVELGGTLDVGMANYGKPASVQVRVVESYPGGIVLRSDWSSPVDAGVAVSTEVNHSFHRTGVGFDTSGQFTWVSAPAGSGYSSVEYRCSSEAAFSAMAQTGTCHAPGSGTHPPSLTLRVLVAGRIFERTYYGTGS
jgi:hypothetical protein